MNPFDIVPQNMARRAEAQPARNSTSQDGGQSSMPGEDFGELLNGLKDGARQESASGCRLDTGMWLSDLEAASEIDPLSKMDPVGGLLGTLLPEGGTNTASPAQIAVQVGSSILSALQGLLPRAPADGRSGESSAGGDNGTASLRPGLSGLGQAGEGADFLSLGSGPTLKVSVQHQETHFKPVIEEFNLEVSSQAPGSLEEDATAIQDGLLPNKPADAHGKDARIGQQMLPVSSTALEKASLPVGEGADVGRTSPDGLLARAEMVQQSGETGPKAEPTTSLPPATLHRIAGAVLAEVKPMAAELNARSTHAPGFERLTSTRASEGVLRVLNLQLQPAELGLVTIKMRLAGDGLEMELQVASEETAQLLRNDTEKLSSLLRGSGYRPDTISIQVGRTEAAAQDGGFSQRQDTMSQSQQQGFHQGAANQGGRSRQQDDGYAHERTGVRNDANDEDISAARSSGGVYL